LTKARTKLIRDVTAQLEEAGFSPSSQCDVRPSCFDLVARREDQLILVKVLANIDSLTNEDAIALQLVAHFFNATPLIIGNRTRSAHNRKSNSESCAQLWRGVQEIWSFHHCADQSA
jgi:predicted transcriptional regulator